MRRKRNDKHGVQKNAIARTEAMMAQKADELEETDLLVRRTWENFTKAHPQITFLMATGDVAEADGDICIHPFPAVSGPMYAVPVILGELFATAFESFEGAADEGAFTREELMTMFVQRFLTGFEAGAEDDREMVREISRVMAREMQDQIEGARRENK